MMPDLVEEVTSAVITETIFTLPNEIYSFYENVPGRAPSELTLRISETVKSLDKDAALELITDVVDRCNFSILYLLQDRFKNLDIETRFEKERTGVAQSADRVLEVYRSKIDPGGVPFNG
jgi:hypothetical protein